MAEGTRLGSDGLHNMTAEEGGCDSGTNALTIPPSGADVRHAAARLSPPQPGAGHPVLHSRDRRRDRRRHSLRNARDRGTGQKTGRKPRRAGANDPKIRAVKRQGAHSGRAQAPARCALHARPRRGTLQSRHDGKIPSHSQSRKTPETRPDGNHAKTCRTRERTRQRRQKGATKTRLTKHLGQRGGMLSPAERPQIYPFPVSLRLSLPRLR